MFKLKFSLLLCVNLLPGLILVAQYSSAYSKGDTIANLEFKIHLGDSSFSTHLYDLKKKLIILDFWGTDCLYCIKQMPETYSLQKIFRDDVQFILVTKDKKQDIDKFWEKLESHASNTILETKDRLPFVLEDSNLAKMFPHHGKPCHVWIDSNYVLRGVAYSSSTTEENIQAFISGKDVHLTEQGVNKIDFNNPISWLGEASFLQSLNFYSFILSRIEHTGGFDGQFFARFDSTTRKVIGISSVNARLADLYKLAYFKYKTPNIGMTDDKILLQVKNKDKFYPPNVYSKFYEWADSSLFCYAIRLPENKADKLYDFMKLDLDRYFHYHSKLEYKKVKCLVLKRSLSKPISPLHSKDTIDEIKVTPKGLCLVLKNQPIDVLFSYLQTIVYTHDSFQPLFEDAHYSGNIDITLPWDDDIGKISIQETKKALRNCGLELKEEYRNLKMIVISDKK